MVLVTVAVGLRVGLTVKVGLRVNVAVIVRVRVPVGVGVAAQAPPGSKTSTAHNKIFLKFAAFLKLVTRILLPSSLAG